MRVELRRVCRLSLTTALALAVAYGLGVQFPFIAPLFAFALTAAPGSPMGPKGVVGVALVFCLMLGVGLLLIPVLLNYPAVALLLVLLGLYAANYMALNLGKGKVGSLLTVGITLISALGLIHFQLATLVIAAFVTNFALAVVCQWVVYPLLPEDEAVAAPAPRPDLAPSNWQSLRATLIVYPCYLLLLTNPAAYAPIMMKSVALAQQASETDIRHAGRELVGSTFMAAVLAILFWFGLKLMPNLWMFFLLTLLFSWFIAGKLYGHFPSRYTPSFWINAMITMLIFIGPAVEDSASGKDPYTASLVRLSLFVGIALFTWGAMVFLEWLRARAGERRARKALRKSPA